MPQSLYAAAKSTKYQIELIIFKNINPTDAGEQFFSQKLNLPSNFNTIENFLPSSALKQTSLFKKLKNSSEYKPIAHLGWIQNLSDIKKPIVINTNSEFTAVIKFTAKKYLHANLSILLDELLIKEQRKLMNNQVNYLDHPKFGVIIAASQI
jgi:hypothetical protein